MKKLFKHSHIQNLYCEIICDTKKGFKVSEFTSTNLKIEPKQRKIRFYHSIDFQREDALWKEITN